MSETADRFRRQGLQLMIGAMINLVAAGLVVGVPAYFALWQAGWAILVVTTIGVSLAVVGVFMLLGGSVLLVTADRPPFSRRRTP